MNKKPITLLTIAALIASLGLNADVGDNDSSDDFAIESREEPTSNTNPSAPQPQGLDTFPDSNTNTATQPSDSVDPEAGTTPIEKEVSKLPDSAQTKKHPNLGNILMAGAAVVIAVVALIFVGKNSGRRS